MKTFLKIAWRNLWRNPRRSANLFISGGRYSEFGSYPDSYYAWMKAYF